MIFGTALAIGFLAGMMRSAFSIAAIAVLIGAAFMTAVVMSPGPVSALSLLLAIAGYNAGLISLVVGLLGFRRLRPIAAF